VTIAASELADCMALRLEYIKPGTGNISVDDIKIGLQDVSNFPLAAYSNLSVGNVTSKDIVNLQAGTQYYYTVVASNGVLLTQKSNEIAVLTNAFTNTQSLKNDKFIVSAYGNTIKVYLNSAQTARCQLINMNGQILFERFATNNFSFEKNTYPHGIYLLKVGTEISKISL
jgi:hypothetical protein